jgi:hypothetical protein
MTGRADNMLDEVAAELALGHRIEGVARKFLPQQRFEGELLDLALQLLRTLLGLASQILDLSLHGGDLLFLLADPQGQGGFGLLLGLIADGTKLRLHLLLDRQLHLALGVVELALLSDQVGLGLLGFGQLGVALPQHLVELGDLFDLGVDVDGDQALRLLGFGRRDTTAFFIDLGGHLRIDGVPGRGDLRLLVANDRFPTGYLGFFSGELVLVPPAGVFNQRRRQRFRQLDLRSAIWARQCWFGHG